MLIGDQRLTFVEGTVRRSVGGAMLEVSGARESNGGTAAHVQLLGKLGSVYVNVEALIANDFHLRGGPAETLKDGRIALDVPLSIGKTSLPLHGEAHVVDRADGSRLLEAAARLSASFDRFNLGTEVHLQKNIVRGGPNPPDELGVGLLGSGHIGGVRVRGQADFDMAPAARFRSAEVSAYWSGTENTDWEAVLAYDGLEHRARAGLTHIIRV